MDDNGIKKIFQVGDLTQTLEMGPAVAAHAMSAWDVIWNVSTGCPRVDANKRIEDFISTWTHLRKTKLIYHPWSFDPKIYFDDNRNKDTDIFFSMTLDSNWFSSNRAKMFNAINPLRQKYKVMSGVGDQQGQWHGIYGWPYEEGLRRSKICMADTASRNNMTAKYLEAAASGCLIMGDAPWGMDEVFNDDTMAILDYNNLEKDLTKQVEFYLSNPDERTKKAKKLQQIVNSSFTNEASVPILEDKILKALDW
jgi:hypothetical protein